LSLTLPARRHTRLPERTEPGAVVAAVRNASVGYGSVDVLVGVDLDIRAGEVMVLVGPNGAGKSTLMGAIAGDVPLRSGTVEIDGRPLRDWSTVELAMRRAVLLQHIDMSFPFTSLQAVRMGRAPWAGLPAEDDDDRAVFEAMVDTDVLELAGRVFMSLSGGERSRVALARVLAQRAGILLLDEPTAALDIAHLEQVMGIARARAVEGDAVVVVMHDLGLAAAHADRVVVLSDGRVRASGPPSEVMTAEMLGAVYGCPIEIVVNPRTGAPLIVPIR
jgi:iron complex transport system ATP-binding protein